MTRMGALEKPTREALFGTIEASAAEMIVAVQRCKTLAEADRVLLCDGLPKTVRQDAERQVRLLQDLQASAGDGRRLRELLISKRVASRPGAVKLCRQLIAAAG